MTRLTLESQFIDRSVVIVVQLSSPFQKWLQVRASLNDLGAGKGSMAVD